jgi:hypothetical protein
VDVRPSFLGGDELALVVSVCPAGLEVAAVNAAGTARLLAKNPMPIPPPFPPPIPPIPPAALGASAGRFASAPFVSLPRKQKVYRD